MNFIKYNLVLLLSSFPAILLFSVGVVACLAPLALFAKMRKPPLIVVIPIMLLAGAFQIYFWGLWSAFCVAVTYKFTLRPAVTWDWLYFVSGFFDASSLIGWLSYKEQQGQTYERRTEIEKGTMRYVAFAWIAYIFFAIWPSLITPVYGWATDRLDLTKYISPIEWTEQDRQSESHFHNAKKAADNLWDVMGKIGQPGVTQPNISPEQMKYLLADAIRASNLVTDDFLRKTHPDFPSRYTQLRDSLRNVATFFSSGNEQSMAQAVQQYGEYCDWVNAHYRRFRLIE